MRYIKEGTLTIDVSALKVPGDSLQVSVSFGPDGSEAFSIPPNVNVTVMGPRAFALNIRDVGISGFKLVVVALKNECPDDGTVRVLWTALDNNPAG